MSRASTVFLAALVGAGAALLAMSVVGRGPSYADDYAEIDDLMARYLFALDWQDPEGYGSLFTEDGVLVWAGGTVDGREAIVQEIRNARAADAETNAKTPDLHPFKRRHFISNFTVRVDGDKATARSLWFEFNNDGADRKPYVGSYGHLEDELRRVDGHWLFAHHKVYNEQRENMTSGDANPAW